MNKYIISILFISVIGLTSCSSSQQNGFDQICHIFGEAVNLNKPFDKKLAYIDETINKRVAQGDALVAYHALSYANPDARYSLFKQSAESSLKHTWDCVEMKNIMNKANKSK